MQAWIEQVARQVRIADVLDVGVIALLIYWGLASLRERASWAMVIALLLASGLLACARWLEMYLTMMIFQAGFLAIFLGLIVVFQQDIRRAFERFAVAVGLQRSPHAPPPAQTMDTLAEATATLAEGRIGALIVFEGREPIDLHVRGGVPVDALISLALLHSIFHPESPGHDGAVLVNGERIDRLGVHLPLSMNPSEYGTGGTRHAAALGLTELCDALVIAVSEERGTISIAEHGQLREIERAELTPLLQRRYQDHSVSAKNRSWYRGSAHQAGWKLTALVLACALWVLFAYHVETIQRTFVVPIEYRNLSGDWVVAEPRPTHAEVSLSGIEPAFDLLDAGSLAVSFDLSGAREQTPQVFPTELSLKGVPTDVTVTQVKPRVVQIVVHRKPPEARGAP